MTHILTHTGNLQSHLAGALRSARWLYAFVLIPFHCFQQRKMERFSPRQKLTHTAADCGAAPHTLTHTGKRADGTHGAKSFRPLPFWGKNARKPLCRNGWRAFYHLVRMRSAVRIRPAAPTKNLETATKTATGIKKSAGIAPGAALYASRLCSQLVRMW